MSFSSLLGLPAELQALFFDLVDDILLIEVASTVCESACPGCQCHTSHIHSHYTRKAADLACGGHQVQLILHVRKFFCPNRDCPRKIFAERLTAFLPPWARVTTRLGEQIEAKGLLGPSTKFTTLLLMVSSMGSATRPKALSTSALP